VPGSGFEPIIPVLAWCASYTDATWLMCVKPIPSALHSHWDTEENYKYLRLGGSAPKIRTKHFRKTSLSVTATQTRSGVSMEILR